MRLLTLAFLLVASAADAGQQSPGNDRNKDGSPADRRNIWELQQRYDANGMPRSQGYDYQPSRRYEKPALGRLPLRTSPRQSRHRPAAAHAVLRCVEGWNGQIYVRSEHGVVGRLSPKARGHAPAPVCFGQFSRRSQQVCRCNS